MANSENQLNVKQVLEELNAPASKSRKYSYIAGFAILLLIAIGGGLFLKSGEQKQLQFETVPIKRGDLTVNVTATGKLEPVTQVDIGIEVSGTVKEINADFNDHVKAGQILATLDLRLFDARVKQSQGALNQAKARLIDAEATIAEKNRVLAFMRQARQLSGGQLPAKQDIVTAEANLKRALAQKNLILGSIAQAEGQLKFDQTNLVKASIRTPIDGIVLDRRIEKGQTVAASLQTPVMFTVAKNLTEMKLKVDVDEADVGKVKLGQSASFNVDAYPDKSFPARISEIRYAPQTVGGVVTYQVVLLVSNADLLLRPGMTATADITVDQARDVWLVPNAALKFSPAKKNKNNKDKKKEPSFLEKLFPRSAVRRPAKTSEDKKKKKESPKIWILENKQPKAIPVKVGLTDGDMNQVTAPELEEGMSVITDSLSEEK
jgi:HlyD family secretion protein